MIEFRKQCGLTFKQIAKSTGVSAGLLRMVEDGEVTHPKIAKTIGIFYNLTDNEIEELIPKNYRKGPDYDPDKYKIFAHPFGIPNIKMEEADVYIMEHHKENKDRWMRSGGHA